MKRPLFFLLLMLTLTCESSAQEVLILTDAVNIALKNSLDIEFANNRIEAAAIRNSYGFAGGYPTVNSSLSGTEQLYNGRRTSSSSTSNQQNYSAQNIVNSDVTGSILLYNGGRVIATKKRYAALELQSRDQLNAQVQNIMASVMTGYYDVVRQQDYIKTIDLSIAATSQQLDIVKVRQKVGLANNADLFQAQIDLNVLLQSKLAQELVVQQATSELLRLLTLNADSSLVIRDTILIDKSLVLDSILSSLNKNADVLAAERQIRINEFIVRETAAQRYPSVYANTGYVFNRNQAGAGTAFLNQSYGPTVGFTLTVPIFNGSIFRRQQQAAEIDVENAGIQRQILIRDFRAQAVKQYQAYTNTISQLDTAQANFKLSSQLVQLTLLRFQLKQATAVEVKDAQQSFEESGFRLVNLNFAAKSAEIELKRLANVLTP